MSAVVESLRTRPARMEDLAQVVEVLNAFSAARYGTPEYSLNEVRAEWESGNLNLEQDTRVALEPDGHIAAFAEFWDDANGRADDLQCYLHCRPGEVRQAMAAELIDFLTERGRRAATRAEPGKEAALATAVWLDNKETRGFFEDAGFQPNSFTTRMEIEFDGPPEAATWPDGIQPRGFQAGVDDRAVHATRQEAWADMRNGHPIPFEMWRYYLIEKNEHFDQSLWFMAMDGDEIAGICLAFAQTVEEPDRGWISSVGVKRAYRRKGIAGAMLRHAFGTLYGRGVHKAALSVDSESLTGANRIYERAGMRPARQTVNYSKILDAART